MRPAARDALHALPTCPSPAPCLTLLDPPLPGFRVRLVRAGTLRLAAAQRGWRARGRGCAARAAHTTAARAARLRCVGVEGHAGQHTGTCL